MSPRGDFEREIHEQPAAMARLLERGREAVERAAEQIAAFDPVFAVLAARGSSDNAARYAQYLLGAQTRLAVSLATPALFTLYGAPPKMDRALVISISQSGQSPDIISVVEEARRQGALTLALTNDIQSPLAQASGFCLPLHAGEERAIAATKTYTNQLLGLAMLSTALADRREDASASSARRGRAIHSAVEEAGMRPPVGSSRWHELMAVPSWAHRALDEGAPAAAAAAAPFVRADRCAVLGRGFNYATAFEIALKMKETSRITAEPYSPADFRHGPVAMAGPGFPALLIAPSGPTFEDMAAVAELLEQRGCKTVVISDRDDPRARARLALPSGVPEWLTPIVGALPGQLLALELSRARGMDPDKPWGLSKVTQTR
jgi:glucosamine--fructose-6-phosphate aminotransferase (isomerizing)